MRIAISFFVALSFVGTDLLVRAANHGIWQALVSTVIDCGWNGIRARLKLTPPTVRLDGYFIDK